MKTTLTLDLFSITFKPSNDIIWAVSSVGRASVLQTGGRRFESCTAHQSSPSGFVWLRQSFKGIKRHFDRKARRLSEVVPSFTRNEDGQEVRISGEASANKCP